MREAWRIPLAVAAIAALAALPARAQQYGGDARPQPVQPATPGLASPLGPGDAIRLQLWQEPALSGDYTVDESGLVVLPLLGVRQVTRHPADQVKRQLVQEYGRQLRNQTAQITLLRRVRVLGAVENPGLYHVDPTMGLADAVALAGGVGPDGNADAIRITRWGRTYRASLERGLGVQWVESGDEIFVPRRSWLERHATWLLGAAISATTLILTRR